MGAAWGRGIALLRALSVTAWVLICVQCIVVRDHGHSAACVDALVCVATGLSALTAAVGAVRWEGQHRWGFLCLAAGIGGYAVGYVLLFYDRANHRDGFFGINASDCASLLLYPLAYLGLSLLAWGRQGRPDRAAILEGAVIACGAGAVTVTIASRLYPSLMVGPALTVLYDFAYPVGGFTLFLGALTAHSLAGWRADRVWPWLTAGFAAMTVGDTAYGFAAAGHAFRFGTWSEAFYLAGPLGVALAASRRPAELRARPTDTRPAMVIAAIATLTAIGTLVTASITSVPRVAVVLAASCGVLAVVRTTLYLQQERQLAHTQQLARTDELTRLPNRRSLLEGLAAATTSAEPCTLILLDLDNFKDINDTFGHAAGDELLTTVAQRLAVQARPAQVYRLGGDEFAVLYDGPTDPAIALARDLRQLGSGLIRLEDAQVGVNASFGVGAVPAPDGSPHLVGEALRRADVALYRAKAARSGVEAWHEGLDSDLRERIALAAELAAAIAAGGEQLVVHLQPQADAAAGHIVGFEALVRWQHPRRGQLQPLDFLDVADSAGLLPAITQIVLHASLVALARLATIDPDLTIAVNLGPSDLLDHELPAKITALLQEHDIEPDRLVIEVNENVVLTDPERMIAVLQQLRASGIRTSLDDYGTGMTSLSYLRRLPLDELKIDRSLLSELETDAASALIVSSTVQLAHGLGLRVVVEGVEETSEAALLAAMGCDTVQGWLIGYPLTLEDAVELLRSSQIRGPRSEPDGSVGRSVPDQPKGLTGRAGPWSLASRADRRRDDAV